MGTFVGIAVSPGAQQAAAQGEEGVPANVVVNQEGEPVVNDEGSYVVTSEE